jgi:hypothetical protein
MKMKYVVSWTYQWNGSATENEVASRRALDVFAKWTPPAGLTFHQFVGRLDGSGGYAVVETDNPMDLADAPSKFGFFAEYQIHPVVDIAEAIDAFRQGVEFRESIS